MPQLLNLCPDDHFFGWRTLRYVHDLAEMTSTIKFETGTTMGCNTQQDAFATKKTAVKALAALQL